MRWFHTFFKLIVDEDLGEESMADDIDRTGHGEGHHHHHHAHSFHHFSGPVIGHHHEISWKDKHGHHHHDYKAYPKYKYSYGVEDHHTKDQHGQKEHRDGKRVDGEYHIHEPGGNFRNVKYHADPHGGFFAEVHNFGGNDHSGATYGHSHKHR
ncbi:histidine-rich glycoprotein [Ooceraea biroi]|uniref:histidine-rich glycoprotein n=1 Tax=Ooceraea biroi TaxID=2015173 RepID=UPI000F0999E8|nr:histidine-rich glycoprotein [Ooceraea biroi]